MGPDGRTLSVSRSGPDLSEFKSAKLRNEEFSEMCSGLRNLKKNEISQNKVFKIQNQDELRKSESSEQWYVDSGASKHICTNLSLFTSIDYTDQVVVVADGFKIKAEGIGTVEILVQDQAGRYVKLTLYEVLYFSSKKFSNLISVHNYNVNYILLSKADLHCIHEWHRMLSHRNLQDIKRLKEKGLRFKDCKCNDVCESCIKGKLARKSFPKEASKPEEFLDLVVSDVCGPMQVKSIQGSRYFITFIEVYSGYTEVSFMREKSEVPTKVIEYIESIKVKFGRKMKIFRSDRGTEYTNSRLQDYLRSEGIKFESTVGYAPEQNGIAERKIRRNPIKDQVIKDYQIEEFSDNIPNEDKIEDSSNEENIIKKPELSKENLQFDPEDLFELTPPEEQIQNQGINANQEEPNQNEEEDIDEEFHDAMEEQEQLPIQEPEVIQIEDEVRRSGRVTAGKLPSHLKDYELYQVLSINSEPRTYKQAIQSEDKDKWIAAMDQEIKSLCDNDAWCLVDLPVGRKAVGSKWVFKKKEDQEGNIIEYKARLVAQGYSQNYGEDYDEVFAPVTRSSTFRLLLAVSGRRKYYVKQFDIKTAFLNGELKEEIYLKQPPGYEINNQVLRLKKSLYGLKQAARVWNQTIHQVLIQDGFIQSQADMCFYIKNLDNKSCYLIIHVDDILIAGSDLEIISQTQATLSKHFQVKDLGTVKFFLGIAINQDEEGNFFINQENYIKKIVSEDSLKESKKATYWIVITELKMKPDISSSVSILSQKVVSPSRTDLNEVKRIIRILNSTRSLSLRLSSQDPNQVIKFYSDANWAEDRRDRKSNSGHIGFVFGGAVSWACRKQVSVSLSSTEAEYIALTEATQEILWLKNLCEDFKIDIKFQLKLKLIIRAQSRWWIAISLVTLLNILRLGITL
ncbi:hypothetical protein PVAND_002540 [Polypedilum vanderplanki]|uniref:Integrase catalytic domain-containing protein n=1 Tax=Polypedilum vanderplanki TaxID=319348 RepID=A0A9J6BRB2_POLVA|nr:hypothetical protein PVAND_002540 [Polypedilum vanderplanki]